MTSLSPKVYVQVLITVIASLVIFLLTGDSSFLVAILLSLVAGGAGIAVKPAPNITQEEVNALSRRKRGLPE